MLCFDPEMRMASSQESQNFETALKWLKANEIFFNCPEPGVVYFSFDLESLTVRLLCRQLDSGMLGLVVFFPIKVCPVRRASVGEYLHRLNFFLARPVLQFDYGDGEVKIAVEFSPETADEKDFFDSIFSTLFFADKISPSLNSVLTGAMQPEFAADQCAAALQKS